MNNKNKTLLDEIKNKISRRLDELEQESFHEGGIYKKSKKSFINFINSQLLECQDYFKSEYYLSFDLYITLSPNKNSIYLSLLSKNGKDKFSIHFYNDKQFRCFLSNQNIKIFWKVNISDLQ